MNYKNEAMKTIRKAFNIREIDYSITENNEIYIDFLDAYSSERLRFNICWCDDNDCITAYVSNIVEHIPENEQDQMHMIQINNSMNCDKRLVTFSTGHNSVSLRKQFTHSESIDPCIGLLVFRLFIIFKQNIADYYEEAGNPIRYFYTKNILRKITILVDEINNYGNDNIKINDELSRFLI